MRHSLVAAQDSHLLNFNKHSESLMKRIKKLHKQCNDQSKHIRILMNNSEKLIAYSQELCENAKKIRD